MGDVSEESRHPLYLMKIGGEEKWMRISEAGVAFDSGWNKVEIGGKVMNEDGSVRPITPEERQRISDIAEARCDSK